jgi:hypothetical protein
VKPGLRVTAGGLPAMLAVVIAMLVPAEALGRSSRHRSGGGLTTFAIPSAQAHCSTAHLRLSSVRILGALGHRIWELALKNTGTVTCTLRGYPLVKLLNRQQQPTVRSAHASGFPVGVVTLSPWQRGFFTLSYAAAGPCLPHFFTAYGLKVFPPANGRGLTLRRLPFTLCSIGLGGHPRVTPVRARLNGR